MILWALADGVELPAWATDPASGLLQARVVKDPLGLEPDRIAFDLTTYRGTPAEVKLAKILSARLMGSPVERLHRIKRHEELAARADRLLERIGPKGIAKPLILSEIANLETEALRLDAWVPLTRDAKRQVGTQKKRGSRHPRLDAWLDAKLAHNPRATNDVLWAELPDSEDGDDLYRDRDSVVVDGKQLGRKGFDTRLTAARKRLRSASK